MRFKFSQLLLIVILLLLKCNFFAANKLNISSTCEKSLENDIEFSIKILCLINGASESTVFSPASILNGLTIILAAAKGETANQIANVLVKGQSADEILKCYPQSLKAYKLPKYKSTEPCNEKNYLRVFEFVKRFTKNKSVIASLKNPKDNVKLEIANRMFVLTKSKLIPEFSKLLQKTFKSDVKSMDFEKPKICAKEINKFAREYTNGQIKEMINEDEIDSSLTAAILVNAVYFKGAWNDYFFESYKATFKSNPPRKIDYMSRDITYGWYYNKGEDWESVGIPYKNKDVWMYIIMPKEENGLEKLIEKMDASLFSEATQPNMKHLVLDIPAFEITKDIDLKEKFQKMGITEIFTDQSDLSNMIKEPMKIGKILHKATIKVDEYGTEASAITKTILYYTLLSYRLRVDRPFLYFITVNEKFTKIMENYNNRIRELSKPKKILFAGTFC